MANARLFYRNVLKPLYLHYNTANYPIMPLPSSPDPYEVLDVPKDADISDIRTAHRKLVLKHHPDRIENPALKEEALAQFNVIQHAYMVLHDPLTRSRYDDKIRLAELRKELTTRERPIRPQAYFMRPAKAACGTAYVAANFGCTVKEAEKMKIKGRDLKEEMRDRKRRRASMDEEQQARRPFIESDDDTDTSTGSHRCCSSTVEGNRGRQQVQEEL